MDRISLKVFLFGGEQIVDGFPRCIEGFNTFTEFAKETLESFETFKQNVDSLVDAYGWDGERTVDYSDSENVQVFEMPDDEELHKLYEFAQELRKN